MTYALDNLVDLLAAPYVAFVVARYRLMRFINQPMYTTLRELRHPQWLAEFLLAMPLFLLGLMLLVGFGGVESLALVMPIRMWYSWLLVIGGAHLISLFWGTRRARLLCSIFEPWVYACLLIAFGVLSSSPRLAVASFSVPFAVSLVIPFTLRDQNGSA